MSEEEIRIAVAKITGKTCQHCNGTGTLKKMTGEEYDRARGIMLDQGIISPKIQPEINCGIICELPNYTQSLDACAEFEATIAWVKYIPALQSVIGCGPFTDLLMQATPTQRCKAFLKYHGKQVTS